MKAFPKLTPTFFLILANVLVYIYTSIIGGNFVQTSYSTLYRLGQYNFYIMNGWYWQLLTSIFVHLDITHLFLNMFFLLVFGLRAEELFSPKEYLIVYFLSGLSGNLLTLIFMDPLTVSAGASGAIFGVFGASVIYLRRAFGQSAVGALLYTFLLLVLSASRDVNIIAHFGGLAAGLITGYILAKDLEEVF